MMQAQVNLNDVNRTIKHILNYHSEIYESIKIDILNLGNILLEKLRLMFPEVTLIGKSVSDFEYLITTEIEGEGLVICSITDKRVITTYEKYYGKEKGKYESVTEAIDWDEIVNTFLNEAIQTIKFHLGDILKS